jgi:cysteine desulfurase / selenocysteine lyase
MNKPLKLSFDVQAIRREFPILSRHVNGKPLVYLDNAASAQKPRAVIEAMTRLMTEEYANVHRGVHWLSSRATERYEAARGTLKRFLNAPDEHQIIFTHGGTEAFNLVASSFLEPMIREGDEIIISEMEHHSNIVPWHFLRERKGAVIKWAKISDRGEFLPAEFEKLFSPRTKFVAITHMSNVLGTITPAKEITRIAHAHGVPVLFDGCQGAVHGFVDVQDLDCDFYVLTGHKLYGPTGIGVLYAKADHLKKMRPYQGGGEMIRSVAFDKITYADAPNKFEAGTPPIIEAVGLGAAIEWFMSQDRAAIHAHEQTLLRGATEKLKELNWIKLYGEAPGKGAIVSFEVEGIHPHDVATIIDGEGVAVRAGHHCAQPLMERLAVPATARASFALYNTEEEVERLIASLKKAREVFA